MTPTVRQMMVIITLCGVISFILGVVAENKKPATGKPVRGNDGVIIKCKYPRGPSVKLGYLSLAFFVASSVAGVCSPFLDYDGKNIPRSEIFKHITIKAFFYASMFITLVAALMLLVSTVSTITKTNNVHRDLNYKCPTARTGVLGGGALLSLDSSLLWLIVLMLAKNARDDVVVELRVDN